MYCVKNIRFSYIKTIYAYSQNQTPWFTFFMFRVTIDSLNLTKISGKAPKLREHFKCMSEPFLLSTLEGYIRMLIYKLQNLKQHFISRIFLKENFI